MPRKCYGKWSITLPATPERLRPYNRAPLESLSLAVDPTAESKLGIVPSMINAEKSRTGAALPEGNMARILGLNTYADQNIPTHTAGEYATAFEVSVTVGGAATTIIELTITGGASTVKLFKGHLMIVHGHEFPVTEDTAAAVAGVIAALKIYPSCMRHLETWTMPR